jgi:V8-like Glu-specific endopeptidase
MSDQLHGAESLSVRNPPPEDSPESARESARPLLMRRGHSGALTQETSRSARAYVVMKDDRTRVEARKLAARPESVIGIDDRKLILDSELAPWRMICSLEISSPGASAIGTGWFVGPRTLLTAGHCVCAPEFGRRLWATSIKVIPGRFGDGTKVCTPVTATTFYAHKKWVDAQHPNASVPYEAGDYDIGCIELAEPLGDQVGCFSFAALAAEDLKDRMVNVSGYPGDRDGGKNQYFHSNMITSVTPRRVFYEIDTFGGQSGSPVWIQEKEFDPPVAIGIHAYGVSQGVKQNSAPRIDDSIYGLIEHWIGRANSATS